MLFAAEDNVIVSATMFAHFLRGGHERSYFIASAHDKSDGLYAISVRQLVTQTGSSFI